MAAYLADKANHVTCVDVCDIPFGRILGSRVGLAIQKVGVTHSDTKELILQLVSMSVLSNGVSHTYEHLPHSCCLVRCTKTTAFSLSLMQE